MGVFLHKIEKITLQNILKKRSNLVRTTVVQELFTIDLLRNLSI